MKEELYNTIYYGDYTYHFKPWRLLKDNNMKQYKIKVHNEAHSRAIQKRLGELGYSWYNEEVGTCLNTDAKLLYGLSSGGIGFTSSSGCFIEVDSYQEMTLDDLYNIKKEVKVKLNDDYTAIIKHGVVQVGCQDFSFEAIEKLYNEIKLPL